MPKVYVKYKYYPIGIRDNKLKNIAGEDEPTVGDLIEAVKQALPNKLGNYDIDEILLSYRDQQSHYDIPLDGNHLLSKLPGVAGTYKNPLTLKVEA